MGIPGFQFCQRCLFLDLPFTPDYGLPPHRVAVSRTQDTPAFGPALPPGGGPFAANADFRALLLAKALNGEQAAGHARQFHAMATRTRQQYKDACASRTYFIALSGLTNILSALINPNM